MRTHSSKLQYSTIGLCLVSVLTASAGTITLLSDGSTLATALGPGVPPPPIVSILQSGNTTGLVFVPALIGGFGTFTAPPPGSPAGTDVINIPPGDGESGFFEDLFTLPASFSGASLSGAGNIDDQGWVFLNGNLISPTTLTEYGNVTFSTSVAAYFQSGVNVLLVADDNSGGGPSGAAFYANVNYHTGAVPDSGTGLFSCFALVCMAMEIYRRRNLNCGC